MTQDEILNMPAGRKMNQLIWWKIFDMEPTPPNNDMALLPDFSGEVAPAFSVIEKIKNEWDAQIQTGREYPDYPGQSFGCRLHNRKEPRICFCLGDTAPLAICRAALLAVIGGV